MLSVICIIILCSGERCVIGANLSSSVSRTLPVSLYEAAKLDGASGPQSFWHLSIPMLKPITSMCPSSHWFGLQRLCAGLRSGIGFARRISPDVRFVSRSRHARKTASAITASAPASEAVVLLVIVLGLTLIQFSMLGKGKA